MSTKTYTVSQVSRLAHVTVRALHHYDEIGLLVPSERADNGYRRYTNADLQRLHQILLFKELGFSLDAIAAVIEEPPAERRSALLSQREKLKDELQKTAAVLRAIETAIQALEGDTTMDANKAFDGFENFDHAKFADEARERWGHTGAYRESERRTKRYTRDDWARIKAEGHAINTGLAELLSAGGLPTDSAALDLAEQHRRHIDRWFYPCSHEMHAALGEMYVADPRFTETYEKYAPGLAHFIRAAIKANAAR